MVFLFRTGALLSAALILLKTESAAQSIVDPLKHDVLALNPKNYVDSFEQYRTRFPGAILYYKDAGNAAEYINSTWNPLAKKLRGMARVGAVDCKLYKSLCSEISGSSDLEIRVFPTLPQPSYKIDEHLTIAKLRSKILKHLPSGKFKNLSEETELREFIQSEANIPKVLLWLSQQQQDSKIGPWWHALIHNFGDRMSFAQISNKDLAKKLKLIKNDDEKLAVAIKIKDTSMSGKGIDLFKGDVKDFAKIQEWLNVRSETFARGGGIDHNIKVSSMSKPWLEEKYPELTRASHKDLCFALKDELCAVLATASDDLAAPITQIIDDLRQQVKKPALRYSWFNVGKEKELAEALGLSSIDLEKDLPIFIVINPHKRLRFVTLKSARTTDDVLNFIEKLKSGDARFTLIKGGIPTFASRVASKTEEL